MIKIFYGSDSGFSLHKAEKELKGMLIENEYQEILRFDGYKDPLPMVMEDCSSISLFGDRKIVLFTNCYFLSTATGKKSPFTDAQQGNYRDLAEYAASPSPDTLLYMVVDGEIKKTGDLYKALAEAPEVEFVSCALPSDEEYLMLANKMALNEKKSIDKDALEMILARSKTLPGASYNQKGVDYLTFVHNVEKLLIYTDHVKVEDVKALIYRPLEDNVFEIVTDMMNHNTKGALSIYADLRAGGIDPLGVIPAFASKFRDYALVKYLIEEKENNDSIADILGKIQGKKINPKSVYYRRKEVEGVTFKTFLRILADLAEIEQGIKRYQDDGDTRIKVFISLFDKTYLRKY